ncbi:MAG: aldo/keto reductase [Anaerovoracaceae bacterium]
MQIAKQHNKTIGQVALRFLIQNGIIAIPKSAHKNRMKENIDIFDFSLSDEEMKKIEELDLGENIFMNHENAEDIDKFFKAFNVGQK